MDESVSAVADSLGEIVGELLGFCGVGVLFDCVAEGRTTYRIGPKYLLFKFDRSVVKLKPTNGSKDNVSDAEF